MRLLIVGPPGSGKGTQGAALSSILGVPHISVGALLREQIDGATLDGRRAREYVARGELVPTAIVVQLLRERFRAPDVTRNGYLLDGFPRHRSQVRWLSELGQHGRIDALIHLVMASNTLIRQRLSQRARADDHPSALRRRIAEYESVMRPMLRELERDLPAVVVDAMQPVDDVTVQILSGLERMDLVPAGTAEQRARGIAARQLEALSAGYVRSRLDS